MKQKQFVVIGLGGFGSNVAIELINQGYEVLGIDLDEHIASEHSTLLTHVVSADATDEDVIRSLGITNFDCAILSIGEHIQAGIMAAIILKELGVKQIVAKAVSELHGRVLEKIGVDKIIYPEKEVAIRIAHQIVQPKTLDYISLSKNCNIAEFSVPSKICGKKVEELKLHKSGCDVVAIHTKNDAIVSPDQSFVLCEQDKLLLIGSPKQIERFEHELMK
ncbi:potassium channel family protein [Longirhabdus pacifica]|uniref:potassium channel family protein n=1 Tax=Longirhabdus pacifica TaxID=2305227 RepID=UPI001008F4BC|nr:TrkA family potassium uptake protein [Longirhabdus pacifica]